VSSGCLVLELSTITAVLQLLAVSDHCVGPAYGLSIELSNLRKRVKGGRPQNTLGQHLVVLTACACLHKLLLAGSYQQ
jgi:hypothetical protein